MGAGDREEEELGQCLGGKEGGRKGGRDGGTEGGGCAVI